MKNPSFIPAHQSPKHQEVDDTLVFGHKSSEWLVPTMLLGFCGGVASAFNPIIGGLLALLSFLCSIALLNCFAQKLLEDNRKHCIFQAKR